ncbi:hypothetical protein F511_35511 [Dorcoceras hygrometricum]|uniref:Uncharacterized protein n=1 Tax=Dorcoceras hygrometricum TaxID=472368 RepID=A0A2Z7BDA3_9LAMI|nr:hypothetical protein F511_35511 [Dorcoceras hygrometricum]
MQYRLLSDILAKSLFVKAGSFDANIPGLDLGESKAFLAPRILNEKTVHRIVSVNENVVVEEVAEAPRAKKTPVKKIVSKKRPSARDAEVAPVVTKKRTTKSKPVAARRISLEKQVEDSSISDQPVEGVATVEQIPVAGVTGGQIPAAEEATEDADATIKQVLNQLDLVFEKPDVAQGGLVETWFDKAFDEEFEIADRERQDTEEEIVVGFEKGTSAGDQPPASENGADGTNDDESLSIEEHQAQKPFNASLPSTLAPPITQIRFGQGIEFRDVDAYTPNLPRIDISDKGKGILVEDDIQGHPARETFSLICADIEFLIALREKVIEDVSIFVSSFSLRKLASLQSEDIFAKEGQVLSWAEIDSSYVAIQRRQFIIAKYRELLLHKFIDARRKNFVPGTPTSAIDLKVLNLLSAAHLFALKDLLRNMKAHQLEWTRPSSSSLFEGPIIDRGSSIPVTHRSISSKCWIRAKIMVDESVQDIDSRPSLSRELRVVWAEICMESIQFSILGCLRPCILILLILTWITLQRLSLLFQLLLLISSLLDALQASLCQRMDDANNEFLSRLHSTERSLQTSLGHQNDYLRRLIEGARQEGQTQDDIQLLRLNELRKSVMAHDVKADTDSLDVRNNFIALDAKFRSLDGQIATIRNDQLEFQTKIAADILGLSTKISEIADYIRSGDGKKGEIGSSSRRPLPASQPSSHVQVSAVRTQTFPPTTGTFAERVEQARRHIIESGQVISTEEAAERVNEADRQESDRLERERARERRELRLSRSGAYKRRRE